MTPEKMDSTMLQADTAQLRQFNDVIFKHCEGITGWIALRAFEHEREGRAVANQWVPFGPGMIEPMVKAATQVANRTGERRAVFSPPVAIFGDGVNKDGNRFAGETNVIAAPAINVELDKEPRASLDRLIQVLGEPTLIIASGGFWKGEPKLHAYWRLGEPATTENAKAALKSARKMATKLVDGDGTAVALSHPMRMPGSWHTKDEPVLCKIIGGNPDRDIKLQWAVEALDEALMAAGLEIDGRGTLARAERKGFKTDREWPLEDLMAAADAIPNDHRVGWDEWNHTGLAFYDASHGSPEGLEAFIHYSEKNPKGDAGDAERRWKHYASSPPEDLSGGTLIVKARETDPDFRPHKIKPGEWFDQDEANNPENDRPPSPEKLPNLFERSEGQSDYFDMLSVADIMALPAPRYLIDRHLMQQSTCIVYGDPGAGKSFLTLDWALHLSSGAADWHGDEIEPIERPSVIYIAGEGVSGYQTRIKAWLSRHPEADPALPGFRLIHQTMNFTSMEMVVKLVKSIKHVCGGATLIVVDTVAKSIAGAEENSTKEMGLFVAACVNISKHFDCAVIGVHHTNKAGGMRGSSAVPGGVDTIFKLERKKGSNTGYLMCEKQKDGPGEWTETFQLETVCVGVDHKGKPVSSLVVSKDAAEVRETSTQASMLDALDMAWQMGAPWSDQPRSKDRYAPRIMAQRFDVSATHAQEILSGWMNAGVVVVDTLSARSKTKGLRRVEIEAEDEPQNPFD